MASLPSPPDHISQASSASVVRHHRGRAAAAADFVVAGVWTGLVVYPGYPLKFRVCMTDAARERLGHSLAPSDVEDVLGSLKVSATLLGSDEALPSFSGLLGSDLAASVTIAIPPLTDGAQVVIHSIRLAGDCHVSCGGGLNGGSSGRLAGLPIQVTVTPVRLGTTAPFDLAGTVVPGTMATPAVSPTGAVFVPRGGIVAVSSADGRRRYVLQVREGVGAWGWGRISRTWAQAMPPLRRWFYPPPFPSTDGVARPLCVHMLGRIR